MNLSQAGLYPTIIFRTIPANHYYTVKQGKTNDVALIHPYQLVISRRKRLLQTFLNRLARHPIIAFLTDSECKSLPVKAGNLNDG